MRPRLIADGGELTVGRKTASYVYGAFSVRLPEGREQVEQPTGQQDGYIYRPDTRPQGRFDVAFVRADVTNDLESQYSDFETVIDAAQQRSEGDVFFEQDITGRGLGIYRPGQDYAIGSIVDVVIWGKIMPLPVTAIEMTTGADGVAGWRVHVGGQLIEDAEALRSNNDKLLAQIEQERRQQLKKIGAVSKTAATAQSTAKAAEKAAEKTALDLARSNEERIKEVAAFSAALGIYYEKTRPEGGTVEGKNSIRVGLVRVQNTGNLALSLPDSLPTEFVSVDIQVIARISALAQYSDSDVLTLTRNSRVGGLNVGAAESVTSASVIIFPQYDFELILAAERRKRGL